MYDLTEVLYLTIDIYSQVWYALHRDILLKEFPLIGCPIAGGLLVYWDLAAYSQNIISRIEEEIL